MASERFHKSAKDGLLDVLKEATRAEANSKDEDGMTPVLWAAFEGRLDALRLLVGRGGDPDKADKFGNTALHLAAAKGHLHCVDFLIKFGVNLYSLDIDKHSAKDLAAINNRDNILRYLDAATANLELRDRKKAKALKELAEKNCEKRIKDYLKRQQKLDQECENLKPISNYHNRNNTNTTNNQKPSTMLAALKHKIWSKSQGNLKQAAIKDQQLHSNNATKFSELVNNNGGGSISSSGAGSINDTISNRFGGAVQKKILTSKLRQNLPQGHENNKNSQKFENNNSGFKIGEIEPNGRRTITSLTGVQRDSEILYVGSFSSNGDNGKRGKIADIFDLEQPDDIYDNNEDDDISIINNSINSKDNMSSALYGGTLSRSYSQPDFLALKTDENINNEIRIQRPTGLFDRPTLGSLAFRRSVTAALSQLHPEASSIDSSNSLSASRKNLSLFKSRELKARSFLTISDDDSDLDGASESDDEQQNSGTPIQRFLAVWGLEEHLHIFQKQQIDLDTLMLLTEGDLKSLGLPLGPFRKLTIAIQERRNALANPGAISDSRL